MSEPNALQLAGRFRGFRDRAHLSQDELGKLLRVSGNYVSMIELGKKKPGPTLLKLFELIEQRPFHHAPAQAAPGVDNANSGSTAVSSEEALCSMLTTETLIRNFAEVAQKQAQADKTMQKRMVGSLRVLLDEIELRLLFPGEAESAQGGLANVPVNPPVERPLPNEPPAT